MNLHHIGIACKNIELEIENIKKIHKVLAVSDIVYDKMQDASLCIIKTDNDINIELISGNMVQNLLKKRIQYYHVCFEVENINQEILRLRAEGAFLVSEPKEAILFNNKKVAFMQTSYGLIELLEK
jgi:methylmalonyl-CoA/ethylmalonyl-CoA epimerase